MGIPYAEVIGDPIAHSKSPLIHEFWLDKLGLDGDYRAMRVTPQGVAAYISERRGDPDWRGCNVTMPLKRLVEPHLDHVDPSSEWAGSTNCIVLRKTPEALAGCNTDASGVAIALWDSTLGFQAAAMIGSGAAAAMCALAPHGPKKSHTSALSFVTKSEAARLLSLMKVPGEIYPIEEAAEAFSGVHG